MVNISHGIIIVLDNSQYWLIIIKYRMESRMLLYQFSANPALAVGVSVVGQQIDRYGQYLCVLTIWDCHRVG